MRIAVASGKGGTGKTTVAVNLARMAADAGRRVQLLDCDVEEPDCALFLHPQFSHTQAVELAIPEVDEAACTHCGVCGDVCEFHAIVSLPSTVLVFPELCHSCGACTVLCPQGAITETPRRTGSVQGGSSEALATVVGTLDIGEAKSPPVIKAVRARTDPRPIWSSSTRRREHRARSSRQCAVRTSSYWSASLRPSVCTTSNLPSRPFAMLGLPLAVVANRADIGDERLQEYCRREGIEILLEIPDDRRLAEASHAVCSPSRCCLDIASASLPYWIESPRWSAGLRARGRLSHRRRSEGARDHQRQGRHRQDERGRGVRCARRATRSWPTATSTRPTCTWWSRPSQGEAHDVLCPQARGHRYEQVHPLRRMSGTLPLRRRGPRPTAHRPVRVRGLRPLLAAVPGGRCPLRAALNGEWSLSETPWGPLVHARLGVAEDNSGKLVSLVREEARKVAEERGLPTVLIDGAPGIGCPVIASLTGATLVLVVTEPTVSGRHDLGRVLQLVHHFGLPFAVCVNKSDVNAEIAAEIAAEAEAAGALFVRTVRYDPGVTHAMVSGRQRGGRKGRAALRRCERRPHGAVATHGGDIGQMRARQPGVIALGKSDQTRRTTRLLGPFRSPARRMEQV